MPEPGPSSVEKLSVSGRRSGVVVLPTQRRMCRIQAAPVVTGSGKLPGQFLQRVFLLHRRESGRPSCPAGSCSHSGRSMNSVSRCWLLGHALDAASSSARPVTHSRVHLCTGYAALPESSARPVPVGAERRRAISQMNLECRPPPRPEARCPCVPVLDRPLGCVHRPRLSPRCRGGQHHLASFAFVGEEHVPSTTNCSSPRHSLAGPARVRLLAHGFSQ